jgi:hypothetical protein
MDKHIHKTVKKNKEHIKYDKSFIIYDTFIYTIGIKFSGDITLIYITNENNNETNICYLTSYINDVKLCVLSNDLKTISLINEDNVSIYDVNKLLNENILYVCKTINKIDDLTNIKKCYLFTNYFKIITEQLLITYNLTNNMVFKQEINGFNYSFSQNGEYSVFYNDKNIYVDKIKINIMSSINKNTLCISNDSKIIVFIDSTSYIILCDIKTNKLYKLKKYEREINNMYIIDKYIMIPSKKNIYILINETSNNLTYWIICGNTISQEHNICLELCSSQYIQYRDINSIIPLIVTTYGSIISKQLIVPNKQSINKIEISSLTDIYEYMLNDYMKQFVDTDKFTTNSLTNVNVYGSNKSFDVYQGLISGKCNSYDIIKDIFVLQNNISTNNVMKELMEHMYEYVRMINRDNIIKIYYVAYILLHLIEVYELNNGNKSIKESFYKVFPVFRT